MNASLPKLLNRLSPAFVAFDFYGVYGIWSAVTAF